MIRNAHEANRKLVKDGYADFIKSLVEQKSDKCINWRDRFDEEFKVNSRFFNHMIEKKLQNSEKLYQYRLWSWQFELGTWN